MDYQGEPLDMKRFHQMYLTIAALPMVPVALAVALWFMSANSWDSPPLGITSAHLPLFGFLAFISLPLSLGFRSLILRRTGAFHTGKVRFKPEEEHWGENAAVLRIKEAAIIGMVLPEQSAILGFILAVLTHKLRYYIPFASYTVLGWIVMFPRPYQVSEWYARQTRSTTHISVPL
ncbi:MAG: hypothetical protein JXP72_09720 [Coriobacteriia bacterium]|nr:hypothetical protein [Coriobacteriia bacterium]